MSLGFGLLAFLLVAAAGPGAERADRFETPAWQSAGDLSLRLFEGGLLLRHRPSGKVYFHPEGTAELVAVPDERWEKGEATVAACGAQGPPSSRILLIDPGTATLKVGERRIPVAGGRALALRAAPGNGLVAVLSAGGAEGGALIPFFGGGVAAGPFYHQVFALPGIVPVGRPVRLPLSAEDEAITLCWAPDHRYVVYHDVLFFELAIIPVKPGGLSHDH